MSPESSIKEVTPRQSVRLFAFRAGNNKTKDGKIKKDIPISFSEMFANVKHTMSKSTGSITVESNGVRNIQQLIKFYDILRQAEAGMTGLNVRINNLSNIRTNEDFETLVGSFDISVLPTTEKVESIIYRNQFARIDSFTR